MIAYLVDECGRVDHSFEIQNLIPPVGSELVFAKTLLKQNDRETLHVTKDVHRYKVTGEARFVHVRSTHDGADFLLQEIHIPVTSMQQENLPYEYAIPLSDCVLGHLYEVRSINLTLAVFDGKQDFIGARWKFERFTSDEEKHFESPQGGSVYPIKDFGLVDSKEAADALSGYEIGLREWEILMLATKGIKTF